MTSSKRLTRRLSGVLAPAALILVLSGCGRVEPPASGESSSAAAPAAPAAQATAAPTAQAPLPTVVVDGPAAPAVPTLEGSNAPAAPLPASPALAPAIAAGKVQFSADFAASADLSAWSFADINQDPAGVTEWVVLDGKLLAPENRMSSEPVGDDTIALAGAAKEANYSFEATALSQASTILGTVVGYSDPDNYVALLLADNSAVNGKGLQLVQRVNGQTSVLASVESELLQPKRWYTLRVEVRGTQITAAVNGKQLFDVAVATPLGSQVGLYAGGEGGSLFGSARLTLI